MPRDVPRHRPASDRLPALRPALTIAVDFHGVICAHPEGAQGLTELSWPEVPGAIAWLKEISAHYRVCVVSARFARQGSEGDHAKAMAMTWLQARGIPAEWMLASERSPNPRILLTAMKPACVLWIDDRGWTFTGAFPTVDQIRDFRPWNR